MRSPPGDPERRNPEELALDGVSGGIEELPRRVTKYGSAKRRALDVAEYMAARGIEQRIAKRVSECGEWLAFRHYYTVDEVRLHGAQLCKKHLLCPLCAIRRGAKALRAYLERWEVIRAEKPALNPFLVTLTVKDGPDLEERFKHLHKAQRELWMRKHRGRGSSLDGVQGAVWSYEVKRGTGSGEWHPHLHMIALAENQPSHDDLAAEWKGITGDSYIVDVRPMGGEAKDFMEVFKYAVKFSEQPEADTVHAWQVLRGKRLMASSGCFRGVQVPEQLLDDALDLPFVTLFYRYLHGAGYTLDSGGMGGNPPHVGAPRRNPAPPLRGAPRGALSPPKNTLPCAP